jgi:type IV/VI secretion system ImpK/VasF family protein
MSPIAQATPAPPTTGQAPAKASSPVPNASKASPAQTRPVAIARPAPDEQKRSIPDLCAGLFAYVLWLRGQAEDQAPDVRAVYQRFDELLREIDQGGKRNGAAPESIRLVLFALSAFADEMILTSKLPFRSAWADQPLQLTYFNENAAGEEFYVRLESSHKLTDGSAADVLESFYLCLSLGFKGRYGGSPKFEKQRRSVMDKLAADIRSLRGAAVGLSPHAGRPLVAEKVSRGASIWLAPTIALLVTLAVLIILNILVRFLAADTAAAFV